MRKVLFLIIIIIIASLLNSTEITPMSNLTYELNLAFDLYDHGFLDKALERFIALYNLERTPKEYKSEVLHMMGQISYEKKNYNIAIIDWSTFKKNYPDHELSETINEKLEKVKQDKAKERKYKVSALDIANDYYRHNINDLAKEKYLLIYHNTDSSDDEKARALYIVGQIMFEEGDYSLALEDWELLITKYPDSDYAKQIATVYSQISDFITVDSDINSVSLVARAYLQNGDFWSNANREFIIDSSWMPGVEIALKWYDKVLKEFPNTPSAEVAYRRKLFALLGSSNPDDDQKLFGLKEDFNKYMPIVVKTFTAFKKDFPKSAYMQGFRYQIAQAYWVEGNTKKARIWLERIIANGKGKETFYTETAKARLKNLKF